MKPTLILISLLYTTQLLGQVIHDESYQDASFWAFKAELTECVLSKDIKKLESLLADTIRVGHDECSSRGAGCSKSEFLAYYSSEHPENPWREMAQILRFGFRHIADPNPNRIIPHDKMVFQGPSYLPKINEAKELLILGTHVNIRVKPSLSAKVIHQASFEVFPCKCGVGDATESTLQENDGIQWIEIKLPNGKMGYMAEKLTSFSLTKEMTIAKINGEWKIISFYNDWGC